MRGGEDGVVHAEPTLGEQSAQLFTGVVLGGISGLFHDGDMSGFPGLYASKKGC